MNKGSIFWLITFAVSSAAFFLIAAVVGIKGLGDLKALLFHPPTEQREIDSEESSRN